jgi:hypothetical protein
MMVLQVEISQETFPLTRYEELAIIGPLCSKILTHTLEIVKSVK